ncbi:MAG: site-specific DNA-methyltransferase [Cytophagales bacterium]|nr:site-specific DNA-methyltransferase [Cytophagales bacterium]
MDEEKLDLQSPDIVNQNLEKLADLFPNCVTEGPDGKVVDFDLLKQELNHEVIEGNKERYRLEWPGKREAIVTANLPTTKTLRPIREDSVDFDNTENLYIEGDNLEVLKLLQESYLGKIKMIYIDPPYNTGNDFVYRDHFRKSGQEELIDSGQVDEANQRLVANPESAGRYHSDWLSMMYPRLKLARNLLDQDGLIFISIDDNEVHNLRRVCDEIFGDENLLGSFQWRRRQTTDNRNQTRVSVDHECVLAYSKSSIASLRGKDIDESKYKNPDQDPRGPWASTNLSGLATATQRPNLHYNIVDPKTGIEYAPNPNRGWSKSRETVEKMIDDGRILFPSKPDGRPREKKFLSSLNSTVTGFSTWLESKEVAFNTDGTRELTELLDGKYFDFPKPLKLLTKFIEQGTTEDSLVLDFFSGSSATAHAVMQMNLRDSGNRKYIMVQLSEATNDKSAAYNAGYKTICEIGKERIRRAAKKIKEEKLEKAKKDGLFADFTDEQDYGFRVYRLDSSNMQDVYYSPQDYGQSNLDLFADNVKPDRTADDLLAQVMLDWGLPLSLKIEPATIAGKQLFKVAEDSLYACFDQGIDEDFAKAIAADKPLRIVFKDSGFRNDTAKTNVKQLLKQLSPETEMKVI